MRRGRGVNVGGSLGGASRVGVRARPIAEALGISAERLTQAVQSLCPGRDTTEEDDLGGSADSAEGPE